VLDLNVFTLYVSVYLHLHYTCIERIYCLIGREEKKYILAKMRLSNIFLTRTETLNHTKKKL